MLVTNPVVQVVGLALVVAWLIYRHRRMESLEAELEVRFDFGAKEATNARLAKLADETDRLLRVLDAIPGLDIWGVVRLMKAIDSEPQNLAHYWALDRRLTLMASELGGHLGVHNIEEHTGIGLAILGRYFGLERHRLLEWIDADHPTTIHVIREERKIKADISLHH